MSRMLLIQLRSRFHALDRVPVNECSRILLQSSRFVIAWLSASFFCLLNCLQNVLTCPGCCWHKCGLAWPRWTESLSTTGELRIRLVITWLIVWLCVCRSVYKTCFHVQDAADTIAVSLSCARQSARKELEEKEKVINYLTDYFVCVCLTVCKTCFHVQDVQWHKCGVAELRWTGGDNVSFYVCRLSAWFLFPGIAHRVWIESGWTTRGTLLMLTLWLCVPVNRLKKTLAWVTSGRSAL